jgi:alkylation response protein AidB-like acyl-CoA dehydrogenase
VSVPAGHAQAQLDDVLAVIAAGASERDSEAAPGFPDAAISLLEDAGLLAWNAQTGWPRPPAAAELELVRRVACADGSVGRIFDGHLNAVERLAVQAPAEVRERELSAILAHRLRAGVWGGDPGPGEGPPASVLDASGGEVLRGVKTFCSGAGGLDRALILARQTGGGPPVAVWIDLTDRRRVEVDPSWYRSHGLRASVSHRVVFHDAPVIARFGQPGSLAQQPWFGRDALRTAASWAGMADTAVHSALHELSGRPGRGPLEALAAGRILTAQRTIDLWLDRAAASMDEAGSELPTISVQARVGIADASRVLLDEAARACGSRPFATAGALDRARRDLEVFLLQHRLDPLLARLGEAALGQAGAGEQLTVGDAGPGRPGAGPGEPAPGER